MDIGNKIYRIIMCEQLFKTFSKHGVECQFESTPGVGCEDGTLTIKILLHQRHNQNLPKLVEFTDIVNSFDTTNHVLHIAILGEYGTSPRLCSAIKHMYDKMVVKLIIGNIETAIEFKLGVKYGNSMVPVLFMFLIIPFDKTLEERWTDLGLSKDQFSRKYNSPRSTGELVRHRPRTFTSDTLLDLF